MIDKRLKFQINKISRKLNSKIISKLYRDTIKDQNKSILVAGSARSGTTWLADLIASQFPSRFMFEPFNPDKVKEYRKFNYFQYMRPDDRDQGLYDFCEKIFSGNIHNAWIDREIQCLNPQGRVIKCIRANLMLRWIDNNFPEVPKIFIIRHPCAVVLSRMRLGWATDGDILHFLNQPLLVEDHLKDKMDVIHNLKTVEQKHAMIWCVTNAVPLQQFQEKRLNLIKYEDLVENYNAILPDLFESIGLQYRNSIAQYIHRPSSTATYHSSILKEKKLTHPWKKELNTNQIDGIIRVVDQFGLTHLYPQ